jgi:hypothetical protein
MNKEIIFAFVALRFPGKPIPDIIKYDLHNAIFIWIPNLPLNLKYSTKNV